MVSIIIPVYNAAPYIADTLESVLQSTYTDIEIVCMDDGSTDKSWSILKQYAEKDKRIRVFHQENAGVCKARNEAIAASHGEYILPIDADDLLLPQFIAQAVSVLNSHQEVKVVAPTAEFFGERTGLWRLPTFNLRKEAHKNILAACAMYRRTDFDRTGGYCEEIIAREDWEFWIHMLKDGGEVVRLPEVGLRYRVQKHSKRVSDRKMKRHVIKVLNSRHPEFFERWLGGPLRYYRSWSHLINTLYRIICPRHTHTERAFDGMRDFITSLPVRFSIPECGRIIYKGRNELREFDTQVGPVVVKSFRKPNFINRIAYGLFRPSKAERSCRYASMLRQKGIGSPAPVGWYSERGWLGLFFGHSYYASQRSELPYTYIDIIKGRIPQTEMPDYLRAVGRLAGRMHNEGIIHRDFSRGNLLLGRDNNDHVRVEVVDLNRLRFHPISLAEGVKNFERLPATPEMRRYLAEGYAIERDFDIDECLRRWPQTEAMDSPEAKAQRA